MSESGKRANRLAVVVVITGTAFGAVVFQGAWSATPATEGVGHKAGQIGVRPTPTVRPFPPTGTVPVVTPSPSKSSVAPSGAPKNSAQTLSPVRTVPKPKPAKRVVRDVPRANSSVTVTTIRSYRDCTGYAQSCIDKGYLTKYNPGRPTLAGHNYMGYQWLSRLPVGRVVKITSGSLKGTYKVYDHAWSKRARQGGKFPSKAYAADVVLQTCEPTGTGFSLLRRV